MTLPAINVFNFLSVESFLNQRVYETQAVNFLHSDLIQCYFQLAESNDWEAIMDSLARTSDKTVENQSILKAAKHYLNAVRQNKAYDTLAN